jgi:uncharacterized protein (DUF58 family)
VTLRPLAPLPASAWGEPAGRWPLAFGTRFFVLAGLGLVLLVPAWIEPRAVLLLGAWNAIVVGAWALDARRLPRVSAVRVTRAWRAPLSIHVPAVVDVEVEHDGPQAIVADVRDYSAASLRRTAAHAVVAVASGARAVFPYEVEPRERGDHAVGPVVLRYRSAWGLAERWGIARIEQTVRVYPDLPEARRQALFLVRSRQVALEKRRARMTGLGRDFESLRDYRDGDEPRDICWTATARRARLVTRVYQPERSQAVWLLVDSGRLLRAREGRDTKLDRTVNAALAVAQVALAAGDRVGVLAYGRRAQHRVPPARGPHHLRAIVEALAAARAEPVEADHAAAAAHVMTVQKQRALVIWLTDLAETAGVPEVIESAGRLAPRHVVLFAVMQTPEMAAAAAAEPSEPDGMYRMLAAQETLERRDVLLANLRRRGVLVLDLDPGDLTSTLVGEYLRVKDRNLV